MQLGPRITTQIANELQTLETALQVGAAADNLAILQINAAKSEISLLEFETENDANPNVKAKLLQILNELAAYDNALVKETANRLINEYHLISVANAADAQQTSAVATNAAAVIEEQPQAALSAVTGNVVAYAKNREKVVKKTPIEQLIIGLKQNSDQPFKVEEVKAILRSLSFRMKPQEIIDELAKLRFSDTYKNEGEFQNLFTANTLMILQLLVELNPKAMRNVNFSKLLTTKENESPATTAFISKSNAIIGSLIKARNNDYVVSNQAAVKSKNPIKKVRRKVVRKLDKIKGERVKKQFDKSKPRNMLAREIATELKRENLRLFAAISPSEFLRQHWTTNKDSNLNKMIEFSNNTTYMLRDKILMAGSKTEQLNVVLLYEKVLAECIEQGDFASAINIYAVFIDTRISRLGHLEEHFKRIQDKYGELFTQDKNYKNLVDKMNTMEGKEIVPYLLLLTRNYTFLDDGNPEHFADSKATNISKLEAEGSVLASLIQQQALAERFLESEPQKRQARNLGIVNQVNSAHLGDEDAQRVSLLHFPRDTKLPVYNVPQVVEIKQLLPNATKSRNNLFKYCETLVRNSVGVNNVPRLDIAKSKGKKIEWAMKIQNDGTFKLEFKGVDVSSVENINPGVLAEAFAKELIAEGYKVSLKHAKDGYIILDGADIVTFANKAGVSKAEIVDAFSIIKADTNQLNRPSNIVMEAEPIVSVVADANPASEVQSNAANNPSLATVVHQVAQPDSESEVDSDAYVQADAVPAEDAVAVIATDKDSDADVAHEEDPEEHKQSELDFLKGDKDNDSAYKKLTDLLKLYNKAVYESQYGKADKDVVRKVINSYREQIAETLSGITSAATSSDAQVKAIAAKLQVQIKPMVDQFNQLESQLQKPVAAPVAPKSKKSIKNVAKSLSKRVKAIRHTRPKEAVEESPYTLELINRLREETLKSNSHEALPERKVAPVAQPAAAMPNDSNIGIDFEDDEVTPAASSDRTAAPVEAEPAVEQRSVLIEDDALSEVDDDKRLDKHNDDVPVVPVMPKQPAPNSPHMKAFTDFQRFQTKLAVDSLDDRNQIKVDAMKMGVRFMLNLPKESKPKNLSDIIKQAMVVNPSSSLEITTKEAAKTILAAIISPNADLNDLTAQAGKIISRIEKLKETNPMTPQIKKKIALREDVHKYLRTLIEQKTLEMNDTVKAQVERAQPIIPTNKNFQSDKRAQAKTAALLEDPKKHLELCINAFKELIESTDDAKRAKFLKDGSNVPEELKSMLTELKHLNPQKVTADDVERLYIRGKKYWKEEGSQPLKDNPLIKLRDQLPRQQPGMRHSI